MKTKISFLTVFVTLSFFTFLFSSFEKGENDLDPKLRLGIDIQAFPCVNGGETLVVYNPNDPDLNFYNSKEYQVMWLRAGELAGTSTSLQCICKGKYAVIVLNRLTQTGVGKAFYYSTANCNADYQPRPSWY